MISRRPCWASHVPPSPYPQFMDIVMKDDRITRTERPLLLQLTSAAKGKQTFSATVYVLTADKVHEWVPVEGTLTVDEAAELFEALHKMDARVKGEVAIPQWQRGDDEGRDAMLAALSNAFVKRRLLVTNIEFQC